MKKNELKKHYQSLSKILDTFIQAEREYDRGKNKKIRDKGLKDAKHQIYFAERYFENTNLDLLSFLMPSQYNSTETNKDYSAFARAEFYNELMSMSYFSRDMQELLDNMQKKIKELPDEEMEIKLEFTSLYLPMQEKPKEFEEFRQIASNAFHDKTDLNYNPKIKFEFIESQGKFQIIENTTSLKHSEILSILDDGVNYLI